MAGSMKWFVYTVSSGGDFAIWAAESNMEIINGDFQDFPNNGTILYALPRNISPRRVSLRSADGLTRRSIVALHPDIFANTFANRNYTDALTGKTLYLVGRVGESIRVPVGVDTGLIDGDSS
jgi:hypothetical protein